MTNVHIKEAANNMRKAVNDVRLLQKETQDNARLQTRELEQRINSIETRKQQLQEQMRRTDNATTHAGQQITVRQLDEEIKQLQKSVADLQSSTHQQVQDLDRQAYDFENLAGRLEMMA